MIGGRLFPIDRRAKFSVVDVADWLLRSLIPAFEFGPSLMKMLEERGISACCRICRRRRRTLRNLGLIRNNGPWRFTPTRSAVVDACRATLA
jgi:hypothetical protein